MLRGFLQAGIAKDPPDGGSFRKCGVAAVLAVQANS
jgi:hypothetical protein